MATPPKTAKGFAKKFSDLLKDFGKTQRQIADECDISTSVINRLCRDGTGSESHICIVLQRFEIKRRRIVEILTDRRAELSDEPAKNVWENFRYAFVDEKEYLRDICPFPLERAYACTQFGIHILDVVRLALKCGISKITDTSDINASKLMRFMSEFEEQFGREARKAVFSPHHGSYPPVLLMDFKHQVDVSNHIKLVRCKGQLLFGLPHLIVGNYTFTEHGEIARHRNTGGIEFLCSLEGDFELTCDGITYSTTLKPGQTIFVFDARKSHKIKLIGGTTGRLLLIRYYPQKKELTPGTQKKQNR